MKISSQYLYSAIAFFVVSSNVQAQASANADIETMVVSGTRKAKLLSDSPVQIDVIDGETINMMTKGTLADVLEYLPGVLVTRSRKDGYNVSMRGFDSKYVRVLLNGRPLVAPSDGAVDLDQISANDIEQVEIMRGAASVLYGSSALGGVINIITKQDDETKAVFTYELGHYGKNAIEGEELSEVLKTNLGTELSGWYHALKIHKLNEAGFDYVQTGLATDAAEDAAGVDKLFVNYSAFAELGHINTTLAYEYFDEYKEKVTSALQGRVFTYSSDVEKHQFDVNLHDVVSEWKLNGRYVQHEETSGQSGSLRKAEIQLAEVDGLKVWQTGTANPKEAGEFGSETVVGFALPYDALSQCKLYSDGSCATIEVDDRERHAVEVYGQYNLFTANYQLLAGIRAQEDSDFGAHSAMQLDGMLDFEQEDLSLQVRFGYGQGYRVPDLKERFYVFDHSNLGYMVLGGNVALGDIFDDEYFQNDQFKGQELVPEESDTYSASADLRVPVFNSAADYNLLVSVHYSETENFISTVNDAAATIALGLDISRYTNISESINQGIEIANELNFNDWTLGLNYSYLQTEDGDGNRITGKPKHQAKARFSYDFRDLDVSTMVLVTYQADEAVPEGYTGEAVNAYGIVDLKMTHRLNQHLNWHLEFNNIFDEHQDPDALKRGEFDPRPVASQEIRLGATYKF